MTKEDVNYAQNQTRSSRRKEIETAVGKNNAHSLRNHSADKGYDGSRQRRGRAGTNTEGTGTTPGSVTVNGKLARQLRKQILSQLAEQQARRETAQESLVATDEKIKDLQGDLANIEQLIQELEELKTEN